MKSTVLLIDDDPVDIKAVQALLETWDLQVLAARSGEDAMAMLEMHQVDLIVSDVRMPGMTGEDVVIEIEKKHPGLPVVLITAHADIKSAVRAMKLGAYDYVTKPPDEEELHLTIDRALEHGRLARENEFLRSQLAAGGMYCERLIARSVAMQAVFEVVERVAGTDSTVLITGETGTGKELIAQSIHYRSARASAPFVALNCAALNANLIESELFGHEKGAFTGAVSTRRGRFEEADNGTLLLDEIGKTTLEFQAKLLRVLQEGEFERVGSTEKHRVDVRLITSTNGNLEEDVKEGRFREDLLYRLNVIPIHLPPLRERREDIELLAVHFVDVYSKKYNSPARSISSGGLQFLTSQEWKGNVRELQHAVERAVVLSQDEILDEDSFRTPGETDATAPGDGTLAAVLDARTREYLVETLDRTSWHKQHAADLLGVDRATLYRMLKKFGIESPNS